MQSSLQGVVTQKLSTNHHRPINLKPKIKYLLIIWDCIRLYAPELQG